MQKLNLPAYPINCRDHNGKQQVFDPIRKKYVALTSEEWVRQNFIAWLVNEKQYPPGLIAIEKELVLNELKKRFDIVVFNRQFVPSLLIECKAPEIKITQKSFDQAARYNMTLKVSYLAVTNGLVHYCCYIDIEKGEYSFIDEIPDFEKLF